MSTNAAIDLDALYYLYVNNEWAGPYQVAQIRELVKQGNVDPADTYAYAAAHQRHYTVEELLNATPAPAATSAEPASASRSAPALFDDILEMAPQTAASFDNVLPDLKTLYTAYLGLTEHSAEPQKALKDLHAAHQGLIQELDHRRGDTNALSRVINEIDEVGDYLANRHQLTHLWQLLSEMEKVDLRTKADEGVASARAVLASLVAQAETKAGGESGGSSSVLLDLAGLDDEADSVITRKILLSARSEVASTKRDMDVLQQTYNELQDQHAKDLEKARKLLEKAEAARAEERHAARQTAAEVRNLAAEIQRLASEPDITGGSDRELAEQVARLGEELKTADASTLAYIAEDVLIRMVAELRQLATSGSGGDIAPLRAELALARESLAQAQAQVAQLTSERDALRLQYEQSRLTAEKASERAKDREHRLRSTVTALEVTKELHMEVMEDLKSQLQTAQGRVEQMERDLANVRGEMKDSTGTVEARGKAIQHEMQRMVEMKAMLEVRSNELSESLKTAEDELAKAQVSQDDTSLAEALAAKVTQLRTTYEATINRLREQEGNAERLARELEASRREAEELRGRGDQLSSELGEARGSLSAAKHRLDELHQAYARLEAEREALHTELHHRKSTDTIHKQAGTDQPATEHISRLERESALLQRQLTVERRQAEQLAEARQSLENRIAELMSEREDLRRKFDNLQNEHFNDHARHTAAIAVSTQAAIESERRLRELQNRVAELESQLTTARKGTEGDSLEPTTARIVSHNNALESVDQEQLRAELNQVTRERDQVLAELETIRTSTTSRSAAVPENVAKRLIELERDLTTAKSEIVSLDERHAQVVAERDRLRREFERLKGELESAAVEHRTALKSARERLVESQERVAELERKLSAQAADQREGEVTRTHLDHSLAEQERLSREVQRLVAELARLNASVPADRDQQIIGLAKASQQLAAEQEKVLVLTRSLMETLQQADNARERTLELQTSLDQRTSERDRLQQELDRQRAELTNLRLSGGGTRLPFTELQPVVEKRDKTLAELEEVRAELAETRERLDESTRARTKLEALGNEQARIRSLESELEQLRSENEQRQQMFNEARARLVQVSSERDRLAAELAELKSRPDQSVELKMLRRRLIRAKRIIKRLRRERDEALDERLKSASNLHQLTGQLERLKSAQRAAVEALGVPPAALQAVSGEPGLDSRASDGFTSGGFGSRAPGPTPTPTMTDVSQNRTMPRALTRRLMPATGTPAPGFGFTSAFGKPTIPNPDQRQAGIESSHAGISQTHITAVQPAVLASRRSLRQVFWQNRLMLGLATAFGLGGMTLAVAPPLIPISTQAVVNAPTTPVKARIDGRVFGDHLQSGRVIDAGQMIGELRNDLVDESVLRSLEARKASLLIKTQETEQLIAENDQTIGQLSEQIERYRSGVITDLTTRLAKEEADIAKQERELSGVSDPQLIPGLTATLEAKRHSVDQLARRLSLLKSGQFDPMDAPVAQAKVTTLQVKHEELRQQKKDLLLEAARFDELIATEKEIVASFRSAKIVAPISGVLWAPRVVDGQSVKAGNELLQIADYNSMEIEALLPERYRFDIAIDSTVVIITHDGRHLRGILSGPLEQGTHNKPDRAVKLSAPAAGYDKMYIKIDATAAPLTPGQKVKVIVHDSDPGILANTLAWFYETTRL